MNEQKMKFNTALPIFTVIIILLTSSIVPALGSIAHVPHFGELPAVPSLNPETTGVGTESWNWNSVNSDGILDDVRYNGINKRSESAIVDENSVELVLGLDASKPTNHAKIVDQVITNGGEIVDTVSNNDVDIALVAKVPLNVVPSFMAQIRGSNLVNYIEPNMKFQMHFVPNDFYWSSQWGPRKIGVDWAWNTTMGDEAILVAIVDTGIDYDHLDLAANYVPLGLDWYNNDTDPMDDNGHGTHVAGIIAAVLNNSVGIAGIANIRIMAEKALGAGGQGWEDDLAQAIIHAADQGADIISNSWGGYGESMLIHDAVKYAYNKGALIIASAGNEAWNTPPLPASYDEVVAVTATDSADRPAEFTNYGDWVEVAAPGVDIFSTVWPNSYAVFSGTSMAAPHVAGLAALIWSQFPNATRDWVRAQLRYTADDLGMTGLDEYYGYGRINAKEAVETAPLDHDLLIFGWDRPRYADPGDSIFFNITVMNFGTNDEYNVTVILLIDGNQTASTTINQLTRGSLAKIGFSWAPLMEKTYNVTIYVAPVPGETITDNNGMTEAIFIRNTIGYVLVDQTRCDPIAFYSRLIENLTNRGYSINTHSASLIDPDILVGYDILVIPQAWYSYANNEILAIEEFVLNGGGLFVIGDDFPLLYNDLTEFAGINWFYESYGWRGNTSRIYPHDVTLNVSTVHFQSPWSQLTVGPPAIGLIQDGAGHNETLLAASEIGAGKVIAIADDHTINNYYIGYADNFKLANNMLDWLLGKKYDHEIIVHLKVPSYPVPGEMAILNATVYNRGLNNETEVELLLLVNGTVILNTTIPEIRKESLYTVNHPWTPLAKAFYNLTVYAPPLLGENVTLNNMRTRLVEVHYPLISPSEGQYTKYVTYYYNSLGYLIDVAYINFTYDHYVEPYKLYTKTWFKDSSGHIIEGWMVINTYNRFVESGMWSGFWYTGWIETDITEGSTINLQSSKATINGSRIFMKRPLAIDCWEIPYSEYGYLYNFVHDKTSGLLIQIVTTNVYGDSQEQVLVDTNVPIGIQHEHDLGVLLDAPKSLEPGHTFKLNVILYNLGQSNETNVELRLLINGTLVISETLSEFPSGTSHAVNYSWTPFTKGFYNITVDTSPVQGENLTVNNIISKVVHVRYAEVALISDENELTVIVPVLNSMGIGYHVYNDNSRYLYTADLSLLRNYNAVIFYTSYRWITPSEQSTLELYLSLGGNLLVTGYDSLVIDTRLASLVRSSSTGENLGEPDLIVVDYTHPIMSGPYGSFPAGHRVYGLYADCDAVEADTLRRAVTVAELADGYDKIIATDSLPGKVVFWNGNGARDWLWNRDSEVIFKNLVDWLKIRVEYELTITLDESAGPSGSEIAVKGTNATADSSVAIYWDTTLMGDITADNTGTFTYLLRVPINVTAGTHEITAVDTLTNRTASATFRILMLTATPAKGSTGTKTTVKGAGFPPGNRATITFNDLVVGQALADDFGNFTFTFNIPLSTAGTQVITTFDGEGNYVETLFTVTDATPLDIEVDVGSIHFRGESAEFYAQVKFKGKVINATEINATLYGPVNATVNYQYPQNITFIASGFYKIAFTLSGDAPAGTYALVVRASYTTNTIESDGTSFKSFLLSPTLTGLNALLIDINGTLGTVRTDLGVIMVRLDTVDARLVSFDGILATLDSTLGLIQTDIATIQLNVTAISGNIATIQTLMGTFEGRITSIEGNMATIETDLGTVNADISSLVETQQAIVVPLYLIPVLVVTVGVAIAFLMRRKAFQEQPD